MAQETPVLDRTVRHLLNELAAHPGLPIYELTPDCARSTLLRAQSGNGHKPDAQIKDWNVGTAVGPIRVRTIRPNAVRESSPVIL
jgi:hypothetical protein